MASLSATQPLLVWVTATWISRGIVISDKALVGVGCSNVDQQRHPYLRHSPCWCGVQQRGSVGASLSATQPLLVWGTTTWMSRGILISDTSLFVVGAAMWISKGIHICDTSLVGMGCSNVDQQGHPHQQHIPCWCWSQQCGSARASLSATHRLLVWVTATWISRGILISDTSPVGVGAATWISSSILMCGTALIGVGCSNVDQRRHPYLRHNPC
jgi:hypothetical protein